MQVKLLRVLQDKEVRMVGDSRGKKVDGGFRRDEQNLPGLIQGRMFRESCIIESMSSRSRFRPCVPGR